jgi:hypothetical protein
VAFVVIGHIEGRFEHDLVVQVAKASVVTKDAAGKAKLVSKTRAIGSGALTGGFLRLLHGLLSPIHGGSMFGNRVDSPRFEFRMNGRLGATPHPYELSARPSGAHTRSHDRSRSPAIPGLWWYVDPAPLQRSARRGNPD